MPRIVWFFILWFINYYLQTRKCFHFDILFPIEIHFSFSILISYLLNCHIILEEYQIQFYLLFIWYNSYHLIIVFWFTYSFIWFFCWLFFSYNLLRNQKLAFPHLMNPLTQSEYPITQYFVSFTITNIAYFLVFQNKKFHDLLFLLIKK